MASADRRDGAANRSTSTEASESRWNGFWGGGGSGAPSSSTEDYKRYVSTADGSPLAAKAAAADEEEESDGPRPPVDLDKVPLGKGQHLPSYFMNGFMAGGTTGILISMLKQRDVRGRPFFFFFFFFLEIHHPVVFSPISDVVLVG